jgi:hypothetical protein
MHKPWLKTRGKTATSPRSSLTPQIRRTLLDKNNGPFETRISFFRSAHTTADDAIPFP